MFDTGRVSDEPAANLAALAELTERIRPTVLSAERTLPVAEPFRELTPLGGIARGSRLSLRGRGSAGLAMTLLAEASRAGSWIAVVGIGAWGWAAAARAGWSLERSVFVVEPPTSRWATTVAALVDAVDVVVVDPLHQVTAADARRLVARSRERGSVIVDVAIDDGRRRYRWPTDADLALTVDRSRWTGLEEGHGMLAHHDLRVVAGGRRGASRPREVAVRIDDGRPVPLDERATAERIATVVAFPDR